MDFEHALKKYMIYNQRFKKPENDSDIARAESVISAPYTSFTGATLQKGKALASEIESYRRRVQALINFFGLIAPHWWDRLYPYKDELVKRPSRSADLVRITESRLSARIQRLTPRMVMPAAAAVSSIEERDSVAVLPKNLYRTSTSRERFGFKLETFENSTELVKLALSLARRLGEIERAKQQIILYVDDWIMSDGRNFHLRARRTAMLAKNVQSCLIERFIGVQALITHYYRRRASMTIEEDAVIEIPRDILIDPKIQLQNAFNSITAANLNVTNPAIMKILKKADLSMDGDLTMGVGVLTDIEEEELIEMATVGANRSSSLSIRSAAPPQLLITEPPNDTDTSKNFQADIQILQDMNQWNLSPIKGAIPLQTDMHNPLAIRWSSVAEASYFSLGGTDDVLDDEPEIETLDMNSSFTRRQSRLAKQQQSIQRNDIEGSIVKLLAIKQDSDRIIPQRTSMESINEFPYSIDAKKHNCRETRAVLAQNLSDEKHTSLKRPIMVQKGDTEFGETLADRPQTIKHVSSAKHSGVEIITSRRSRSIVDNSYPTRTKPSYYSTQQRHEKLFPTMLGNQEMIDTDFRKLLRYKKKNINKMPPALRNSCRKF